MKKNTTKRTTKTVKAEPQSHKMLIGGVVLALLVAFVLPIANAALPSLKIPVTFQVGVEAVDDGSVDVNLGSVTGPDSYYPYQTLNGVERWYDSQSFAQGTSTVCRFRSPSATSTVSIESTLSYTTGTSTATTITTYRGASAWATTTSLNTLAWIAGSKGEGPLVATSSTVSLVFPASQWLIVDINGGPAGASNGGFTGNCNVIWNVF